MKGITPRGYVCGFTEKPLVIDGRLDEAAWQAASWTEDFTDIEGSRKPRPRFRTRAKMLWDNDYLLHRRRDGRAACLGHGHAARRGHFSRTTISKSSSIPTATTTTITNWNSMPSIRPGTCSCLAPYKDGGKADNSFELTGMKTAVRVKGTLNNPADKDEGWCVEIAIPWKALAQHAHRPSPPSDGDQWRVDFSRVEWKYEIADGKYVKVPNTPRGQLDLVAAGNHRHAPAGALGLRAVLQGGAGQRDLRAGPDPSRPRPADGSLPSAEIVTTSNMAAGRPPCTDLGMAAVGKGLPRRPLELKLTDDGFQAMRETPIGGGATRRLVRPPGFAAVDRRPRRCRE